MPPVPIFFPPDLLFSISRPRVAALFAAYGCPLPAGLLAAPSLTLARALWPLVVSSDLADVVDLLALLSSPTGAAAVVDASRAARCKLPLHLPRADVASVLLTLRAADASYEPVLERALHAFARVVPRRLPVELVAREPRKAGDPARLVRALASVLGKRFVDAWYAFDEATGRIHVAVVRRARARAAAVETSSGVARRVRRDLRVDVIRVDVPEGRVILRTRNRSLEAAYAKAVASSLFDDEAFFADAPAHTLKSVVRLGSKGLAAHRAPGVSRMRVVDITWDDGEGTTHNEHGSDALAAFEARGGSAGGYVTGAMFRMDTPASPRPIDVALSLPDRAHYRSSLHEGLARAALASVGAFSPGAVADDAFTLAPWIHAEWRWRKLLGDARFDGMVARKELVRAKTRMVGDPAVGKYGWSYVAFDLRSEPGKQYAVALDPRLPSRDLKGDERRMWRLDPAAVASALRRELGSEAVPPDPAIGELALDLGLVRDELPLRIFALLRDPGLAAATVARAMIRAAGSAHVVVLLPEGRTFDGVGVAIGLSLAEIFGQAPIAARVFREIAEKKGVETVVHGWRRASPGTRFVVEAKTGRMWLDRCELDSLPESGARLLRRVASEGGRPVATSVLARHVSANRGDDGVVRQTVPRLAGWLRDAFAAKGLTAPADLDAIIEFLPNKGWRMVVACEVV